MARQTYAQVETKSADLASDFGLDWATKLFGAEAIASLPVRKAGKNKGKPAGMVIWRKAVTAGWCRENQSPVKVGSLVDAWIGTGPYSPRSDALSGTWLGRVQPLASSPFFLFQEGRDRHAAEAAREAADRARCLADEQDPGPTAA